MPTRSAPTVKRRRLAAELRRFREAAKLTLDEVAERLEWSNAKISRIENARVSVLPRDVKFLLGVYGIDGEAIPAWFEVYIGLEAEAVSVHSYESELVPGLLQ